MKISMQTAVLAALVSLSNVGTGQEKDASNDLDEIVVTGRSITTSSTRVEVEREILVDSAAVLKEIPGANVNTNGMITGIAQYRGVHGDRVSVTIDQMGVISGGPNAMDTPLSYVSPMITEELTVERGIASLSSALESLGGNINARIARGDFGDAEFGLTGFIGSRYSTNGDVSTSAARLTLADDRNRISLIAEIDNGSDIRTPAGNIHPSQLNRKRIDASYAFSSGDTGLLIYAGKLETKDTGTPALPMDIRLIDTDLYGLQFMTAVSSTLEIEGRVSYNDVKHLMDNASLRLAPMPAMVRENFATGSGTSFSLSGIMGRGSADLRVGIDGVLAKHDSVISNPNVPVFRVDNFTSNRRDLLGVYAEWRYAGESSNLELGLRHKHAVTRAGTVSASGMPVMMATNVAVLADNFNVADRDLSWDTVDLVLKYRRSLFSETEWSVEVGTKTRAPSYQELYLWLPLQATGGLADGRTYIGNLNLRAERSNEVVIGLSSHKGRVSLSPQIFFKKIEDYIQGMPSMNSVANMVSTMMSGTPPLQFANVDAEIWGADVAWKVDLTEHLFLDGIASFARGRRADLDDKLYRLAPMNGSVGLTYDRGSWSVKPELVVYAKQDRVSSFNGEQETAGYELVNVEFSWNPLPSLRIEARIDNLLNETYQDHLAGTNRAGGGDIATGLRLYGAERTLSAGVAFNF